MDVLVVRMTPATVGADTTACMVVEPSVVVVVVIIVIIVVVVVVVVVVVIVVVIPGMPIILILPGTTRGPTV
jgi:hypothetical protein